MKLCLFIYFGITLTFYAQGKLNKLTTEEIIDLLPKIDKVSFGYSSMYSGSGFLPVKGSGRMSMGVIGKMKATSSPELTEIVSRGAFAIPFLIKHMNDKRALKIKPVKGMMWMDFSDEYDFNHRTLKELPNPKDVNKGNIQKKNQPEKHQLTIGDICFVALGQIVNRRFTASRYQPTAGLIVNSPTYSKSLHKMILNEYAEMGKKEHQKQLINDIYKPDHSYRRSSALLRLKYYYPELLEEVVLDILEIPTYDKMDAHRFVRKELYSGISKEQKKKLLEEKVKKFGNAYKDGVLLNLFGDLDSQIADEEGRISSPLNPKYDSRNCLIHFFAYSKNVKPQDRPYVNSLDLYELERFIKTMNGFDNKEVNKKVFDIFVKIKDQDSLALRCMKFLAGKGYNLKLRKYCEERVKVSEDYKEEFTEMLKTLQAN